MAEQLVIQLDGGGSNPTSPLHGYIDRINYKEAKEFIEKWHYSKRMPTGQNICFAAYSKNIPHAVISFGIGVNPYQDKFLGCRKSIEIKRMCRSEPSIGFQLSKLIRFSIRQLSRIIDFDCVVAFSDPEYGHTGIVYKASGFAMCGYTNPEIHLVGENGEVRHRRLAFRYSRRHGISISEARNRLCMKRRTTLPKHRWVLKLNKKTKKNPS